MTNQIIEMEQAESSQVAQTQQQDQYFNLISGAIDKGLDITSLERIMDLKDKHDKNMERKLFYKALSKFQSEIPVIKKRGLASFNTKAGKTEYSFAKLEHIVGDIKPYLLTNSLSYRFEQQATPDGAIKVTCIVTHCEGHAESNAMVAFPDQSGSKNTIQQSASTVTYLQRYTLTGALGIVVQDEDNDGDKDHLAISDELTKYIQEKNASGLGAKALIKEFEAQWQVGQVVKEHVVRVELESRLKQMEATLAVNKNLQSINAATDSYSSEIMETCRAAGVTPNEYLDKIRACSQQAVNQAN